MLIAENAVCEIFLGFGGNFGKIEGLDVSGCKLVFYVERWSHASVFRPTPREKSAEFHMEKCRITVGYVPRFVCKDIGFGVKRSLVCTPEEAFPPRCHAFTA